MKAMTAEEFRRELLHPAEGRCKKLRSQVAEAEAELEALFTAADYDDGAAAAAELRVDQLKRELARWERRLGYLHSREVATHPGGFVSV